MAALARFRRLTFAVAIAAATLAVGVSGPASSPEQKSRTLRVMTRNLYLGADLSPMLAARSFEELFAAAAGVWAQVRTNDFAQRARALAAEIAASDPDLLGLQEAALYRTDSPADGPLTPAKTVAQDFVRLLATALKARGESYRVVATFVGGDAEIPVGLPPSIDVRFTDRISLLMRTDGARRGIRVRRTVVGSYSAALSAPVAGTAVRIPRGWIGATLTVRGAKVIVVNTHLESSGAAVRALQGQELLANVASIKVPLIVLGDLNSGPGTDSTVYDALRAGGLEDAWTRVHGAAPGLTCCFAADLHSIAQPLVSRVDHVLYKNGVRATRAEVIGETTGDRVNGLWPSDHAGVVATLRLP